MWCVPKYSNPTGTVYSRRHGRAAGGDADRGAGLPLFWDNAYAVHHLTDERIEIAEPASTACARHGHPHRPFVFGSTSKITLAGAGVALFAGSPENVAWYLARMGTRTIGGDKINQLRHVRFLARHRRAAGADGPPPRHRRAEVRRRARRLRPRTSPAPAWRRGRVPKGGYFISLDVRDGCASEVVRLAKAAGVALTPAGATYPARATTRTTATSASRRPSPTWRR